MEGGVLREIGGEVELALVLGFAEEEGKRSVAEGKEGINSEEKIGGRRG